MISLSMMVLTESPSSGAFERRGDHLAQHRRSGAEHA
jgi:hypothetical protein